MSSHLMVPLSISTNPKTTGPSSTTGSEDMNGSETAEEDDIQHSPHDYGHLTPTSSLAVNIPSSATNYFSQQHNSNSSPTSVVTPTPNNPNHHYSSSPSNHSSRNSKSTDGSTISVPPSPSIADSELDSPSSLGSMSSFNSYVGKRSGDLADVEDLDLDDYGYHNNHEPELETVSEIDEEESSSSFCSGSGSVSDDHRTGVAASILDSDLEEKDPNHFNGYHHYAGSDHHGSRRRLGGLGAIQNHLHHNGTGSGLHHFHLSHFSPRHGGHGLSSTHARIHSGRLNKRTQQAQLQKGRIAELLEEGGGEGLPAEPLTKGTPSSPPDESEKPADPPQVVEDSASSVNANFDRDHDWGSEFPPPLPHAQRSISPSDTIPAVPSPLCECVSVEETVNESRIDQDQNANFSSAGAAALEESVETLRQPSPTSTFRPSSKASSDLTPTNSLTRKNKNERNKEVSSSIKPNDDDVSSPGSTPPSSPVLVRTNSRGRRASSPTRSKPKVPLRPCFKRRTSAQTYHGSASHGRDSSSERESSIPSSNGRGRAQVRFSNAPPQEARTHSPVEYDRKSCPISNRLSPDDVEELRSLRMEMNLLESKWKSMSACERHKDCQDERERIECRDCENLDDSIFRKVKKEKALLFRDSCGNTDAPVNNRADVGYCKTGYSSDSISSSYSRNNPSSYLSPSNMPPPLYRRGSADNAPTFQSLSTSTSNSSSSSSRDNDISDPTDLKISAAQHLRLERERERERERKNLLRFSHARSSPVPKSKNLANNSSLIARFGLTTPPPPLPGTGSNMSSPQGSSRSVTREASKEDLRESSRSDFARAIPQPLNTEFANSEQHVNRAPVPDSSTRSSSSLLSPRSSSAPPTSRTPSEERIHRLSHARQSINDAENCRKSSNPSSPQDLRDQEEKEEAEQVAIRGRSHSISPSLGSSKGDDEDEGEDEEQDQAPSADHLNRDYSFSNRLANDASNSKRDPSTDTIVANSPTRGRSNFSRNTTPSVTITAPSNSSSNRASKQEIEESEAESDYGFGSSYKSPSSSSNPYKSAFSVGSSWSSAPNKDANGLGGYSWNSTPTTTPTSSSFPTGYDSPASEFYESGSEYDLLG